VIQTLLVLAEQENKATYVSKDLGDYSRWAENKDRRSEILNVIVGVIFLATLFKISSSIQ
jgi:hypothetical protein